jgi:hypothetical protein
MAEDRIRRDQDDLDLDEPTFDEDGGIAEIPDAAVEEDEDLEDE